MEYLPPDTKVGSIIEKLKIKSKIDKSELSVYVHLEVLGKLNVFQIFKLFTLISFDRINYKKVCFF